MDGPVELSDELLRPALEFAVLVAGLAKRARPPIDFPAGLKPYLSFQKLPAKALGEVRRAVEADEAFRKRLGDAATEDVVGPLCHLWLSRPDGWEDEAARLATEQLAAQERQAADKQERAALKRAEAAEASAARARAEQVVLRADLSTERQKRQTAEATLKDLGAQSKALSADVERMRADHRAAADQASAARRELDTARARLTELQAAHDALAARLDETLAERAELLAARPAASQIDSPGVAAAASGLRDVAAVMAQLATSLSDTAAALGATRTSSPAPPRPVTPKRARSGRTALRTPGGLVGNQPEVVHHFLRVPGVVFVIDGYNVAKTAWPDLDLEAQREQLLDALDDLVRRIGTRMHVVFDGAGVAASTGRRLLNVRFSPAGVTADDVIRQLVAELPDETHVVVVTSDNAIVNDVRAMGANTLGSAQFRSVLGR